MFKIPHPEDFYGITPMKAETRNLASCKLPVFIILLGTFLFFIDASRANEANNSETLTIGIKQAPPFAIKNADDTWSGISVDLWQHIANELKLDYQFKETDLNGLLNGVKDQKFDASIGAITVTSERIKEMDFSHPFYTSGLSIAVPAQSSNAWLGIFKSVFSWQFVSVVSTLLFLLLVIGFLAWFFEHKHNKQFNSSLVNGIGSGLWWSAVTMTTVGYGDKAPVTLGGRLVALIWMFASIIVISGITASIASSLTVGQLSTGISGPKDLYTARTATVSDSSSQKYLQDQFINSTSFSTPQEGLTALTNGEIDAFVYDKPLLQYLAKTNFQGQITVLQTEFQRQDYAFALPTNSSLKKSIDQLLLDKLESHDWQNHLVRYLGAGE